MNSILSVSDTLSYEPLASIRSVIWQRVCWNSACPLQVANLAGPQFSLADGSVMFNQRFEQYFVRIALHENNYLRQLRFVLFCHSLLLNEELIHLFVFILHVKHKVEHKLSDSEFHLTGILI